MDDDPFEIKNTIEEILNNKLDLRVIQNEQEKLYNFHPTKAEETIDIT